MFTITGYADTGFENTGPAGAWATDDFSRTITLSQSAVVPASDCGGSATHCWLFAGTVVDSGSFTGITGALGIESGGTTITGTPTGTINGGGDVQFYASAQPVMPATLAFTESTLPDANVGYLPA